MRGVCRDRVACNREVHFLGAAATRAIRAFRGASDRYALRALHNFFMRNSSDVFTALGSSQARVCQNLICINDSRGP
jgi:hypothetical protein